MSHLHELERLEAAAIAAKELEATREREVAQRTRSLTALRAQRLAYEREVGGGAERDLDFERETDTELVAPNVEERTRTPYGRSSYVELVDLAAEARLAGARDARAQAEQRRDAYCRAHGHALAVEVLTPGDAEQAQAIVDRLEAAVEAVRAREARRLRAARILRLAGLDPEHELPLDPIYNLEVDLGRPVRAGAGALRLLPDSDAEAAA